MFLCNYCISNTVLTCTCPVGKQQIATLKCLSSRNKDDTTESVEGERFSVFKNGSLQINQAGKEDSGEYVCFATNSEGKSAITALLDVKGISAP